MFWYHKYLNIITLYFNVKHTELLHVHISSSRVQNKKSSLLVQFKERLDINNFCTLYYYLWIDLYLLNYLCFAIYLS